MEAVADYLCVCMCVAGGDRGVFSVSVSSPGGDSAALAMDHTGCGRLAVLMDISRIDQTNKIPSHKLKQPCQRSPSATL